MDIITYALCRRYVRDTAIGLGAVMGAPCTIESIIDTGDANVVTFKWTGTDGTERVSEMIVRHGIGIADMNIDDTGLLTCTLTDGTIIDVGQIPLGNADCCNHDTCTCITNQLATNDDVDPLLEAIGLFDATSAVLLDEFNNVLTDELNNILTT